MRKKHKVVERKLLSVWKRIKRHHPQNDAQKIAMLQCEAAWDLIHSMRILAQKKHGAAVMILCRSLFERSAATDVLVRNGNAQMIQDYIDYGKTVLYEVGEALNAPQAWLRAQKKEYDAIKQRLGKKRWYGSTKIEDLLIRACTGKFCCKGKPVCIARFTKRHRLFLMEIHICS